MTDNFEMNHRIDGDIHYASDVREDIAFRLTSFINFALDGTSTNQDNLDLDLFGSDTATVSLMTYDAINDRYNCNTGAGTDVCVLTTDIATIPNTATCAVVKGDITKEATTTVTIEVSFNNGGNWTSVTEKTLANISVGGTQMKIRFTFTRSNTASIDYITSYGAYWG